MRLAMYNSMYWLPPPPPLPSPQVFSQGTLQQQKQQEKDGKRQRKTLTLYAQRRDMKQLCVTNIVQH